MKSLEVRFLDSISPEPTTGCWLWTGNMSNNGYGRMGFKRGQKTKSAHRISWTMFRGNIPNGMMVCHKCDTPLCVNPEHLFVGTHQENVKDMVTKGRTRNNIGSSNSASKLTENIVFEIRKSAAAISGLDLSKRFNVSRATISMVINRKIWKHT